MWNRSGGDARDSHQTLWRSARLRQRDVGASLGPYISEELVLRTSWRRAYRVLSYLLPEGVSNTKQTFFRLLRTMTRTG